MTRFEPYGGFPTTHRIFVQPDGPVRFVRPARLPALPIRPPVLPAAPPRDDPPHVASWAPVAPVAPIVEPGAASGRERLLLALEQHGDWRQVRELSREVGIDEVVACHWLDRAFRAGLVHRRHRVFCPREERQFKWKGTP